MSVSFVRQRMLVEAVGNLFSRSSMVFPVGLARVSRYRHALKDLMKHFRLTSVIVKYVAVF